MTRGGKREGTGRPPLPPEEKRVQFWARIRPELKEKIERHAEARGLKVAAVLESLIESLPAE